MTLGSSPAVDDLKEKFKGKCIPTEENFCSLIDLASVGPMLGEGLARADDDGKLEIQCVDASGLKKERSPDGTSGLACVCVGGLTTTSGPLSVQCGNEFDLINTELSLRLISPLDVKNGKLYLNFGAGLERSGDILKLDLDERAFIIDGNTLRLKCKQNGGLKVINGNLVIDTDVA